MTATPQKRGVGAAAGALATIFFALSLALPVATAQQAQGLTTIMGYELLFVGPFGVLNGQFGWIATPCLFVAIFAATAHRRMFGGTAVTFLILAMGAALVDALFWRDYPNDGGPGPLVSHGPGFFLWVSAVLLGGIGLLLRPRQD